MADLLSLLSYGSNAISRTNSNISVTTNNVANVDTPNFKASEVRFEDTLKTALSRAKPGVSANQTVMNAAASRTSLVDQTSSRGDGNNVDIDREMELLGESNLTYSALTQVMSSRIGILKSVISGGR